MVLVFFRKKSESLLSFKYDFCGLSFGFYLSSVPM